MSDRIPELNETLETRQFCSFCRKSYLESESRVASGPGGTICESCLKLCEEVLAEQKGPPVLQYRTSVPSAAGDTARLMAEWWEDPMSAFARMTSSS
ncbi:MAG: hypothetical protein E6I43_07195 [Chloroflexi bacterium]|nr:MAG: hypothetical protein E6I43_07195 [Chloroflexota bacterium]